jgi:hypothetical protein
VVQEAIGWWDAAGITPAQDQLLRNTTILVTPLGTHVLGQTVGNLIRLSPTAAGFGWFVDASVALNSGNPLLPAGHMDLATVLAHEMGHVLGLEHTTLPGDVMDPFLPAGVRRMPSVLDLDTFFSRTATSSLGL